MPREMLEAAGEQIRLLSIDDAGNRGFIREVPLAALLSWLSDRAILANGVQTPLLAPGTRLVRTQGDKTVVVVEQAPQVRRVQWVNERQDAYEPRQLAFPYLVFVFSFDGGELDAYQQLYYRTRPLDCVDAPLLQANLLNVTLGSDSRAHWLCLGDKAVADLPWPAKIETALANFWTTTFNYDFEVPRGSGFSRSLGIDQRIASVEVWEAGSRTNPLFPLEIDWPDAGLTLEQAIAESMAWAVAPAFPDSFATLADALYRVAAD